MLKSAINYFFVVFILMIGINAFAVSVPDTLLVPRYKIKDYELKKCLSKIERECGQKHGINLYMVVSTVTKENDEYIFVGCGRFLSFYSLFEEVRNNTLVGCCYINNNICLLLGEKMKQYISPVSESISFIDDTNFIELITSESSFDNFLNNMAMKGLHYDPPAWIFIKTGRKFKYLNNGEYPF